MGDGKRVSEPQPLPDSLKGKTLFPTVTYRNVTLDVNFGPAPHCPLPFKCLMMSAAAAEYAEVSKLKAPKDGKYEVIFPVGLPDTGYFDFVDGFLEKNPQYTELSDRKIIEWASKSGIAKPQNKATNDKPSMNFGAQLLDDGGVRKIIKTFSRMAKRNMVVAELKSNLVSDDRKKSVSSFSAPHFKRKAVVLMGTPSKEYITMVHNKLLDSKKAKAEAERKKKAAEETRKRMLEEKKKKAEEAKKARLAAAAKKAGVEEVKEETDEKEEKEEKEEIKEEVKAEDATMEAEDTPTVVELT